MAQTILYYPKINIEDGIWLRNAILYWDEISSIVPYESFESLSPELLYLQDAGVYNPVYPQELFYSEFAEDFCNTFVRRIAAYNRSIANSPNRSQNKLVRIHKNKVYAPALHELIHYGKLPPELLPFFKDKRFINDYNCGGWMEIDSKVAQIYMRTLAEYSIKCSDKDIVLGTDTSTHSREIYNYARNRTDLRTQCCQINIEKCLPQPALDVSFEEILDFKLRRKDDLDSFRAKIRELEINIYHADSFELIKHHESQFIEDWKTSSKEFSKVLKESRIKFSLTSMSCLVAIPFVDQLLSTKFDPSFISAIKTGGQLLNIGLAYRDYKNKISPAKTDGGFSYIINANRDGIIHL